MAPPTVTGMSVQFQPIMQTQVVENPQIIEQTTQSNFQTQIQHLNQSIQPMQQTMQTMQPMQQQVQMQHQMQSSLQQQLQQPVTENQQKINGIPFSVHNVQQSMPYSTQVRPFDCFFGPVFFADFFQK